MLWKAIQLNCPLLITCDFKLCKEAMDNGIEVHCSIWVIAELVNPNILSKIKAIELLVILKYVNSRLPLDEIDRLIKILR